LRSIPTDDSTEETIVRSWESSTCVRLLNRTGTAGPAPRATKRVTEVTRFSLAEEVGFEPTVPVDTAVFETARFGRSRTPP
jgi:hypothetical protein